MPIAQLFQTLAAKADAYTRNPGGGTLEALEDQYRATVNALDKSPGLGSWIRPWWLSEEESRRLIAAARNLYGRLAGLERKPGHAAAREKLACANTRDLLLVYIYRATGDMQVKASARKWLALTHEETLRHYRAGFKALWPPCKLDTLETWQTIGLTASLMARQTARGTWETWLPGTQPFGVHIPPQTSEFQDCSAYGIKTSYLASQLDNALGAGYCQAIGVKGAPAQRYKNVLEAIEHTLDHPPDDGSTDDQAEDDKIAKVAAYLNGKQKSTDWRPTVVRQIIEDIALLELLACHPSWDSIRDVDLRGKVNELLSRRNTL